MTARVLTIGLLVAAAAIGHLLLRRLLILPRMRKMNFKGDMIPSAYGAYVALYSIVGIAVVLLLNLTTPRTAGLYISVIGGMALLGLLDDAFGSREAGGFRGHFKKLLLEHEVTTGAVKALGGGLLALGVAAYISDVWSERILNAALIALWANALNLLDLRPGRALGAFAVGLAAILAVCGISKTGIWPIIAIVLPVAALARADTRGQAMMGDTGSNPLGACLGLTLAIGGPFAAKVAAIVVLLGLHVCCERYSLTQIIEKSVIIKKIDSLLGVR
jgi:UDP-GlcNAc:undecaprenyl-phosphate/decaprenyl-phosphate GlcNAc-1-phosphate transferase